VLTSAVPGGVAVAAAAYGAYAVARAVIGDGQDAHVRAATAAFLALVLTAFDVLVAVARPLRPWKVGLVAAMVLGMGLAVGTPLGQRLFVLDPTDARVWAVAVPAGVVGVLLRRLTAALLRRAGARVGAGDRSGDGNT